MSTQQTCGVVGRQRRHRWHLRLATFSNYPRLCCSSLQTQLVIAMIIAAWDGLCRQVISHLCWDQLCANLVAKRIPYDAHMVRVSAWRHAMLFNGPCPFQAAGRHARCAGCGTVIRATVEASTVWCCLPTCCAMYRWSMLQNLRTCLLSSTSMHESAVQPLTVVGGDARESRGEAEGQSRGEAEAGGM